jgi:acetyltransferase-like isoleucine patch superfamily enzyme
MALANSFILKVKRAETPFFRVLRKIAVTVLSPRAPRIPAFLRPPLRVLYELQFAWVALWHSFWNVCYRHPLFQARCASFGKDVVIDRLPFVTGHVEIHVGNGVYIGGGVAIASGRMIDQPVLVLKDHAELGWNVSIAVSREVIIEEYVRVSYDCRISDTDGHPRQADLRAQHVPPHPRDIRPVRICKYAWIGNGTHIMKGVTIGEGAVIGANSVVISDIPPYCLALGNPAEVYLHNYGRPSVRTPQAKAAED